MIVLNEKEYAENCLKNKSVNEKPFYTLSILARYYCHCENYKKKKIIELLIDFMRKTYPEYNCNKAVWDESIDKIAKNARKHKLYEIDGVWITKAELETIESIQNKVLEKLAFTLLCLAKLANLKNPNNVGWVNNDAKEVFALARISCNVSERYKKLGKLHQLSLLEFPRRIDNLRCKVTYINDNSDKVLFVSDFRELGYEYLKYKGENFIRCRECGILIRNNATGTKKYCNDCSGYIPLEVKTISCIDCGKEIEVDSKNNKSCRCKECYAIYRANRKLETQRERRKNKENPK